MTILALLLAVAEAPPPPPPPPPRSDASSTFRSVSPAPTPTPAPSPAVPAAVPVIDECARAVTQQAMNGCAHKDFMAADEELNHQWERISARMKVRDEDVDTTGDKRPGYFATLLDGQRAWLKYRDAHCTTEGYWARGGSLEPLLVSTCKTKLTQDRIQQLLFLSQQ